MTININKWLQVATNRLAEKGVPSAQLDATLILSRVSQKPREYLISHSDELVSSEVQVIADAWLERRLNREPLAYIFGAKEFYGRSFAVTPDTLIPRPETEFIIELFKKNDLHGQVIDIGTGSGCIGLTLKAEIPGLNVTLSDISERALQVARQNAQHLSIESVDFVISDLLQNWLDQAATSEINAIIANLPYVDRSWQVSEETKHEPDLALFANNNGLDLIEKLIEQSSTLLGSGAWLILEADPRQHQAILDLTTDYRLVEKIDFILLLQKK